MKYIFSVPIKKLYDAQEYAFEVTYQRWIEDVLFTFNWWFLLFLAIAPLFIWWKLIDKTRIMEIVFVGLTISLTATFLDTLGIIFSFWTYGYKVVQMVPMLNIVDLSLLPIFYMLIYQWFPKWKAYIVVLILLAAFGSFIAEPIFKWMKIYDLKTWKFIYSFPIYIAMGIGIKALTGKMVSIQEHSLKFK